MRVLALLVSALLVVACSGDSGSDDNRSTATSVDADAPVPAALAAFLERVAAPGEVRFTASYRVLQRLGGRTSDVQVDALPPSWTIRAGAVTVTGGPQAQTCVEDSCEPGVREQALATVGVFSRFFATAQADALATAARRRGADAPVFSTRTLAGVELECVAVPVNGAVAATGCLTPEGVFGYADGPAVTFELTAYSAG